jgi:hypothetical protein
MLNKTSGPFWFLPTSVRLILPALACLLPLQTWAQDNPAANADATTGSKQVAMVQATDAPRIDGVLDEALWQRAAVISDFHQMNPVEYGEPSQRTEIRLFYTDEALYIGARMYEDDPSLIRANVMRQNQSLQNDDSLNIMIDPYFDRRSGYLFEINANGVRVDGIYQNVSQVDRNWSGIWTAKSRIDAEGWTTEVRIPFQSLSFNPGNTQWGMNFRRTIRRNGEEIGWISRNRLVNPGIAGTATNMTGLQQGLGLDIVPYIVARQARVFGHPGSEDQSIEPQLDVYYKVTPQLNAALTLNTDFSATEVDDRVVNLTRFSVFFPERRDFFVRDADIFSFGRIGNGVPFGQEGNEAVPQAAQQNGRPFFSRTIGLSPSGAPLDLNVGAKLSGRAGNWNLGSLVVNQGEDDRTGVGAQSVFVGRAAYNVLSESQVGVVATAGDTRSELDNSLVGTDFRYRNSRLPGGKVVEGEAWYMQTDSNVFTGGADAAWGLGLSAPNTNRWRGGYSYKRIENDFHPALGFINQRNIEDHALDGGYRHFLKPGGKLRSVYGGFDAYRNSNLTTGELISQILDLRMNANNNSNDTVSAAVVQQREVLSRPFTIYRASDGSRSIVIPSGDYTFTRGEAGISSAGQRVLAAGLSLAAGDYYDGESFQRSVNVTWQPLPGYNFQTRYSENEISLPQGDFTVRQISFTSLINFTADLTWTNRIQYDNVSEGMGINSRLYWIPEPGREMYLVLNWGLTDFDRNNSFESTNSDLTFKYNYTFRF